MSNPIYRRWQRRGSQSDLEKHPINWSRDVSLNERSKDENQPCTSLHIVHSYGNACKPCWRETSTIGIQKYPFLSEQCTGPFFPDCGRKSDGVRFPTCLTSFLQSSFDPLRLPTVSLYLNMAGGKAMLFKRWCSWREGCLFYSNGPVIRIRS